MLLKFDKVNDGVLLFFGLSPIATEVMGMISGVLPLPAFCLNSVQVLTILSSVPSSRYNPVTATRLFV